VRDVIPFKNSTRIVIIKHNIENNRIRPTISMYAKFNAQTLKREQDVRQDRNPCQNLPQTLPRFFKIKYMTVTVKRIVSHILFGDLTSLPVSEIVTA